MRRIGLAVALLCGLIEAPATAQSVMEKSPNIQGVWGVPSGNASFVFAHRFEVLSGGDELFSVPTLTLAFGLPLGLTLGTDFTSFSEVIRDNSGGNETQFWLKRPFMVTPRVRGAILGGYNTAASSGEAALDARLSFSRFELYGEARGHTDLFGRGEAGASGTIGASVRITRHFAVTGDIGRVLTEDTVPSAWSAAVAFEIPGSPHTLSFQISNSGATTLQGVAREKTIGPKSYRRGFAFTVPLGTPERWLRIFNPPPPPPPSPASEAGRRVTIQGYAFGPGELRIRAGEQVEWVNLDPVAHTATADDRSWDSGSIAEGQSFTRVFDTPGRYSYFCLPHPNMRGLIIVEP
jgi:plastocyanin